MTVAPRREPLARLLLRSQSDQRLVSLVRDGREQAFEEIVRRYRPGLVAFAAAYAPAGRAEDVVQECLVRAWEALGASTAEIHLRPWLYTIVRNRALNASRDARHHEEIPEDFDGVPTPAEIVLTREELSDVVGAVGRLPRAQRQALVRSAVDGHTHDQIAATLGTTAGGARQLIYRARAAVRAGAGSLVPLPIVRALTEAPSVTSEAAGAGAALTAGSLGAGGLAAGSAGAGGGLAGAKGVPVLVAATLAASGGIIVERSLEPAPGAREARADASRSDGGRGDPAGPREPGANGASVGAVAGGQREHGSRGSGGPSGEDRSGSDSGPGGGEDRSGSNSGPGGGDAGRGDSSGPGPGGELGTVEPDSDHSGSGGTSSGPGGEGSGSGSTSMGSESTSSGPGGESSGSGSGSSGPG
jgi:RNA polymerase sigma factor (sigma-70 family)